MVDKGPVEIERHHPHFGSVCNKCRWASQSPRPKTAGAMHEDWSMRHTVGFDLDMTLVDTRRGIAMALSALAEQTGRPIDVTSIVANLGPPIGEALAPWFSTDELPGAVQSFRAHMADIGVVNADPLPGAAEALDAVRTAGYAVAVVTSKLEHLAFATLQHAGLEVDQIFGNTWAAGKADPLRSANAVCFVGDHPGDMVAALTARIPSLGVTTGSSTEQELIKAGAQHVASSLCEFPEWFETIAG
ncbi:MAG TPA: HAD family hydrolase [Mycobacteriales bacterium]|nr:HAD family hydrolase [Mycobacteriales bacterium]